MPPPDRTAPGTALADPNPRRDGAGRAASLVRALWSVFHQEDVNFLLTNRLPRSVATRWMGRFSRIEHPWISRPALALWRRFDADLDLSEASEERFPSVHACFTRRLREGARPIDPDPRRVISPCDGIVGAWGRVEGTRAFQAKGFPYDLRDLLLAPDLAEAHRDGWFVTLRIRASMYHRLHAPTAGRVRRVLYASGDTWNVNPIALRRVERLFVKNERATVDWVPDPPDLRITLVPIAAILVGGIRLHCLGETLDLDWTGPTRFECDARYAKGAELGWFQHGSTVVLFASGAVRPHDSLHEGARVRVGEPLFVHGSA